MIPRPSIRCLALLLAGATLHAQTASTANDVAVPVKPKPRPTPRPDQPLFNLNTIVLDPAHGGSDLGTRIADNTLEKDVTLAFSNRLKAALSAKGFTVLLTRGADPVPHTAPAPAPDPDNPDPDANPAPPPPPPKPAEVTQDQRVEIANRAHAVACLLLHASNGGHGVHLFTSSLATPNAFAPDVPVDVRPIIPWDTAQATSLSNSLRLAGDLSAAINSIRVPLVVGRASVRPIDSMTCPVIAIELAPLGTDSLTTAADASYQQRVADAVANAMVFWRGHAESIAAAAQAAKAAAAPVSPSPPPPVRKPRPKPVTPPVEVPIEPGAATPTHTPAPIIRRPPTAPPPTAPPPGAPPAVIPRYQRVLYWILVGGILLMTLALIRGCERKHERIAAMRDQSPIPAPFDIPNEQVTVARANDADASVTLDQLSLALPAEPSIRARFLLDRCLSDLSLPASTHPVPPGPAVTDVFLLALPLTTPGPSSSDQGDFSTPSPARLSAERSTAYGLYHSAGAQLAVVNLTKSFADAHPSGIETEDLTLRALIATLHANFPDIEEVRFLVDGQARETLNGHADLTRPYAVQHPAKSIHILSPDGNPL